jgi:hypothetical protein
MPSTSFSEEPLPHKHKGKNELTGASPKNNAHCVVWPVVLYLSTAWEKGLRFWRKTVSRFLYVGIESKREIFVGFDMTPPLLLLFTTTLIHHSSGYNDAGPPLLCYQVGR